MKTLRNAVILTALGATATAIVIMPMDSNEATPVPGVVVTPQSEPSASSTERASKSPAPSASPSDTATPGRSDKADEPAEDKTRDGNDDAPAPERAQPAQAPAPAAPAPVERPAAPAPPPAPAAPAPAPVPQAPVSVPQAPALSSVCEWDDDEWECDDDGDDD